MRAASATRAERFADRTEAKVATASTSVPPAVASDEIVAQSDQLTLPTVLQAFLPTECDFCTW